MVFTINGEEAWRFVENESAKSCCEQNKLKEPVRAIIEAIRMDGDNALRAVAERVGDRVPDRFRISDQVWDEAAQKVPDKIKRVIMRAAENIRIYAQAVRDALKPVRVEKDGFVTGMTFCPVERVGCYVPGGRYPLPSTALMTAVTARVAGVKKVYMVCPDPTPEVLLAARLASVDSVFQCGGAQAVGALAFGTESIPQVDMIVGPGNAYVTEAKRQVQGRVGIDMLAGPSEVAIIADEGARADWIALEMLAQWEHDPDAKAWLFTDRNDLARAVAACLAERLVEGDLPDYIREAVERCRISVFNDLGDCVKASDTIAPEHLLLAVDDPEALKSKLKNYGALFMGYNASVAFGDYMAGPNHTLPTQTTARFSGGLTPLTFLRPQSWLKTGKDIKDLATDTALFAGVEGLRMHRATAEARATP